MSRSFVLPAAFACFLMALADTSAEAGPFRPFRPAMNPNRMPGWDWQRTYPWSPYNYGRNPYNPIVVPYYYPYYGYPYNPYINPYAPYTTTTVTTTVNDDTAPDGTTFPSLQNHRILIPFPSGEMKVAPEDAACIVVRVPDEFTKVLFDGQPTYTTGTKRYFVTPSLNPDRQYRYTITVSTTKDGKTDTKEREISVSAGTSLVLDFRDKK
jgi:uncharacterized protein (TIGR03000 family)